METLVVPFVRRAATLQNFAIYLVILVELNLNNSKNTNADMKIGTNQL